MRPEVLHRLGLGLVVGAALYGRRAFAQATLDDIGARLDDLALLGVVCVALLSVLAGLGAVILGRMR